jgi:hypothetical protein
MIQDSQLAVWGDVQLHKFLLAKINPLHRLPLQQQVFLDVKQTVSREDFPMEAIKNLAWDVSALIFVALQLVEVVISLPLGVQPVQTHKVPAPGNYLLNGEFLD